MKKQLTTLLLLCPIMSFAEQTLDPVVVTATRYELSNLETPAAITKITLPEIGLKFTPTESLNRVVGLSITDTNATDIRLTTRGFGSRTPFATRGVQIYRDGLPITFADATGLTSIVDMNVISNIEVLKGPFSSMYGSSSSGVVQFFTEVPSKESEISGGTLFGSFNTQQNNIKYSGISGNVKYLLNQSNYTSDGYRDFSKIKRDQSTGKLWFDINDYTQIEIGVNSYRQNNQDYGNGNGGITLSQFRTNPYSVDASVYNINSWKSIDQQDANLKVTHLINKDNSLVFAVYGGNRNQEQLSPTTESNTLLRTSSGLLKTSREFWGTEIRLDHSGIVVNKKYNVSFGLTAQSQTDSVTNGKWMVSGVQLNGNTLTRSVNQNALTMGQFVQGRLSVSDTVDLHAGVRRTTMGMDFIDHLTDIANGGNNSGSVNYNSSSPSIGIVWKATPNTSVYSSYAKGLELPTFNETQFASAISTTTPNTTLRPSKSDNFEIGAKSYVTTNTYVTTSIFQSKTNNEIVITQNAPGFKIYGNLGSTTRQGIEFSIDSKLPLGFGFYNAFSYTEATFDDTGKTLPAVPKTLAFTELSWTYAPKNFRASIEAVHAGKVYGEVDNSISDDGYTIFNLKTTLKQKYNKLTVTEYFAVNNINDTVYVANLRTAAQYGRYYESGVKRNVMLGVMASYAF